MWLGLLLRLAVLFNQPLASPNSLFLLPSPKRSQVGQISVEMAEVGVCHFPAFLQVSVMRSLSTPPFSGLTTT